MKSATTSLGPALSRYPSGPGGLPASARNHAPPVPGPPAPPEYFATKELALLTAAVPARPLAALLARVPLGTPLFEPWRLDQWFQQAAEEACRATVRDPDGDRLVRTRYPSGTGPKRRTRLLAFRPLEGPPLREPLFVKRAFWRFIQWALPPGKRLWLATSGYPYMPLAVRRGPLGVGPVVAIVMPFLVIEADCLKEKRPRSNTPSTRRPSNG